MRKLFVSLPQGGSGPDDLLGRLLKQQALGELAFTDVEIRSNLLGLLVGCIPTTSKAAALVIDELLRRPEVLQAAQRAAHDGDSALVTRFVREAIRFAPQAPGLFRLAKRDVNIAAGSSHATTIEQGHMVFAATQSAMLDGEVVDEPDEFRLDRPDSHNLHYGAGMHTCIGRYVNDVQIPATVEAVLRLPRLRRAAGDAGQLVMSGNFPDHLAVEFDAGGVGDTSDVTTTD